MIVEDEEESVERKRIDEATTDNDYNLCMISTRPSRQTKQRFSRRRYRTVEVYGTVCTVCIRVTDVVRFWNLTKTTHALLSIYLIRTSVCKVYTYIYINTYIHTYIQTCMCIIAHIHKEILTYMHIYVHAYIHT